MEQVVRFLKWVWIWFVGSLIAAGLFWFGLVLKVNLGPVVLDIDPPYVCTKFVTAELDVIKERK